jgi:hypothetical protein
MLCEDALHLNQLDVTLIMQQRCVTCCNVRPVRIIEPLVMVGRGFLEPFCVAGKENEVSFIAELNISLCTQKCGCGTNCNIYDNSRAKGALKLAILHTFC